MELFEEIPRLKGPPKATVARRAKSYSDFYDAAIGYLGKEAGPKKPFDNFGVLENGGSEALFEIGYEKYEDDLLDASQAEYQYNSLNLKPRIYWLTFKQDSIETNWHYLNDILITCLKTRLLP